LFAAEYGWTAEETFACTITQVESLLSSMVKRYKRISGKNVRRARSVQDLKNKLPGIVEG